MATATMEEVAQKDGLCPSGIVDVKTVMQDGLVVSCPLLTQFVENDGKQGEDGLKCWRLSVGRKGRGACPHTEEGKLIRSRPKKGNPVMS